MCYKRNSISCHRALIVGHRILLSVSSIQCQCFKVMSNVHGDSDISDEIGEVAKAHFEVPENSCYGVNSSRIPVLAY